MIHNIQSVFYDPLDQHSSIIASGSVGVNINEPIGELKRFVFNENDNQLPGCKATDLHMYPPGTTDYSAQAVSSKTRINQLLSPSQPGDSIILVARPPARSQHNSTELVEQIRELTHAQNPAADGTNIVLGQ